MYDRSILESKTRAELREIASDEFGLKVKVKEVKINLVNAIMQAQRSSSSSSTKSKVASTTTAPKSSGPLNKLSASLDTEKEYGRFSNTITVSCGASSGNYPVVGKKIFEVTTFLREALNIGVQSKPLVNGSEVNENYVLQNKDVLEFVATAGRKG